MKKFIYLIAGILILSAGCSSVQVRTDFDRGADFSAYRTYSWLPHREGRGGMMKSRMVRKHVISAVDRELAAMGFRKTGRERADLLVNYHIGSKAVVDVDLYGYRYGRWGRRRPNAVSVRRYRKGTLILDLVDRESKQLVWRGWATSALHGRENLAGDINRSVRKLLERFPPAE
jgi:hypothetical protein